MDKVPTTGGGNDSLRPNGDVDVYSDELRAGMRDLFAGCLTQAAETPRYALPPLRDETLYALSQLCRGISAQEADSPRANFAYAMFAWYWHNHYGDRDSSMTDGGLSGDGVDAVTKVLGVINATEKVKTGKRAKKGSGGLPPELAAASEDLYTVLAEFMPNDE